jgi:hypothetical protein
MSTDDPTGAPDTTDAQFCPGCGNRAGADDQFCRRCGHRLDAEPARAAAAPPKRRGRRRAGLIALALTALAAGSAALVVVLGGALDSDDDAEAAAAAKGRLTAQRARVQPAFDDLMNRRDELFAQERRHLAAMNGAQEKIRRYRREDREYKAEYKRIDEEFADEWDQCLRFSAIPCPDPEYPDIPEVPGFAKQTKQLRAVVEQLDELRAGLASVQPSDELRVLHTQLLASVDELKDESAHNADVLDEAADPAEEGEGVGTLDKGKLRTLRRASALPAIRQLNLAAVAVITELRLPKLEYDVPGGRDLDAADHSDAA